MPFSSFVVHVISLLFWLPQFTTLTTPYPTNQHHSSFHPRKTTLKITTINIYGELQVLPTQFQCTAILCSTLNISVNYKWPQLNYNDQHYNAQ